VTVKPEQALRRLSMFVGERAIPLWGEAGFDEKAQCFRERLPFPANPSGMCPGA